MSLDYFIKKEIFVTHCDGWRYRVYEQDEGAICIETQEFNPKKREYETTDEFTICNFAVAPLCEALREVVHYCDLRDGADDPTDSSPDQP